MEREREGGGCLLSVYARGLGVKGRYGCGMRRGSRQVGIKWASGSFIIFTT